MFKRKKAKEDSSFLDEPIFGGAAAPDKTDFGIDEAFDENDTYDEAFLEDASSVSYDKTTQEPDEEQAVEDQDIESFAEDGESQAPFDESLEQETFVEENGPGSNEDRAFEDAADGANADEQPSALDTDESTDTEALDTAPEAGYGKHGALEPDFKNKSRKNRRILIVVLVLLVLLVGALGYFTYQLYQESQNIASQQASDNSVSTTVTQPEGVTTKETSTTTKKTQVPNLIAAMGKSQADAVTAIGHGATVAASVPVNEEGNPVKTRVTLALTTEPSDARSGAPSAYLGLNEGGQVVQVGYSASTASLGYSSISFTDAITKEKIIQKTFNEGGLTIADDTVVLPAKSEYSTYASDGTTLVRESCSFAGQAEQAGTTYNWSAILTYDYTAANATSNLADTIRQVFIYINA